MASLKQGSSHRFLKYLHLLPFSPFFSKFWVFSPFLLLNTTWEKGHTVLQFFINAVVNWSAMWNLRLTGEESNVFLRTSLQQRYHILVSLCGFFAWVRIRVRHQMPLRCALWVQQNGLEWWCRIYLNHYERTPLSTFIWGAQKNYVRPMLEVLPYRAVSQYSARYRQIRGSSKQESSVWEYTDFTSTAFLRHF